MSHEGYISGFGAEWRPENISDLVQVIFCSQLETNFPATCSPQCDNDEIDVTAADECFQSDGKKDKASCGSKWANPSS